MVAKPLELVLYPDERLRIKTVPIDIVTPERVALAHQMYDLMVRSGGIGLAAPQAGLAISLITLKVNNEMLAMYNPTIVKRSPQQEYKAEACLSFPGVSRLIKRPTEVAIKYRDIQSKMKYIVLKGIDARCAIHEIEHLQARLFIDHAEST